MEIDFMEAIEGAKKTVKYAKQEQCGTCSGSGEKPGSRPEICEGCNGTGF